MAEKILVTGGAGFVGATLALTLKEASGDRSVIAFDSLKRRGSELALRRLREGGIEFVHGDVRSPEDLEQIGPIDLLLECSAEPSVQAGYDGGARQLIHTNLNGTVNCLELARSCGAGLIFLSTSRVHPIEALRSLPLEPAGDRLVIRPGASGTGWSERGISKAFPLEGGRSLYGATKLCSELLIREYVEMYDLRAVIDRCGVIAGPWQMGRIDQGFFTLWAARHLYGGELAYQGFGGRGQQVRDVLHVRDLANLVELQCAAIDAHAGRVYAVGGGQSGSVSLCELTRMCEERSGRRLAIGSRPETHPSDIPYHVTDNRETTEATGWAPERDAEMTLDDTFEWLERHRSELEHILS
jgi:CDP-paratose 2-epimerase